MIEFLMGLVVGVTSFAAGVLIFAWWKFRVLKKQFGGLLG